MQSTVSRAFIQIRIARQNRNPISRCLKWAQRGYTVLESGGRKSCGTLPLINCPGEKKTRGENVCCLL